MRMLLTWSDRGRRPLADGDPGPIVRLLEASAHRYDTARVLVSPSAQRGVRDLLTGMRAHIADVQTTLVEVDDPTDYEALFRTMSATIATLAAHSSVDVVLSAGTPQTQTIWVIMVKAGLLNARLLQVIPAQFVPRPHPHPVREVKLEIEGFPEIRALREEVVRLRARSVIIGGIVGHSEPMRRLLRRVSRVANSVVPALVLGETGVGKELIARAIHQGSDRAEQAFVTENCGAFSESALNSELFGHEIGAFTGATRRRRGLFEQADGGTLFLDEVGELGLSAQVRLLRVLQDGTLRRMGAETPIHVDVRVVAATHRDLPAMIRAGEFREDLYYRLRGAELHVPPLRTRMSDLEPLVATLLAETARPELRLTRSAWHALQRYRWPGNVRELKAEVRRWTVFCDALVEVDDLSPEIVAASPPATVSSESAETPTVTAWPTLADTEAGAIRAAFAANDGNISRTARVLGIDRNTLKRKLRR